MLQISLVEGEWQRLAGTPLRSEVLGVDFYLEADALRIADAHTGERVLMRAEVEVLAQERLERVEALEAELMRLRKTHP